MMSDLIGHATVTIDELYDYCTEVLDRASEATTHQAKFALVQVVMDLMEIITNAETDD